MLNVIVLFVIVLNVIVLSVVMLSSVAPIDRTAMEKLLKETWAEFSTLDMNIIAYAVQLPS